MRQDDFSAELAGRALGLHQNLNIGFSPIQFRLHRIARGIELARPEVSRDGQEVMVGQDRTEGLQVNILA